MGQQLDPGDLRSEAFTLFGRLMGRMDPSRLEAWAGLGLSITQLRVLFMLRAEEGLTAGALAERLGVTPSTMTRIMDRVVATKLVERRADEEDRRMVRHSLTRRGLQTVEELERTGRARMNEILSHLDCDQLERLVTALRELTAATDAADAQSQAKVEA